MWNWFLEIRFNLNSLKTLSPQKEKPAIKPNVKLVLKNPFQSKQSKNTFTPKKKNRL
jgi:hypothetical protein